MLFGNLLAQDNNFPIDVTNIKKGLALYIEFMDLTKEGKSVKANSKRTEAYALLNNALRTNQIIRSNNNCRFRKEGFSTMPEIGLTCIGNGFTIKLSYDRISKGDLAAFEDIPFGNEFTGEVKIVPNVLKKAYEIEGTFRGDVHITLFGQVTKIQVLDNSTNEANKKTIDIDQLIIDLKSGKTISNETIIDALKQVRGY